MLSFVLGIDDAQRKFWLVRDIKRFLLGIFFSRNMASGQTVNLHLIGKQNSGKSATGNSIVGDRKFRHRSTDSYIKTSITVRQGQHADFTLYVWDWPGTDGRQSTSERIAKELKQEVQDYKFNIHLFGWVTRYRDPCVQEERDFHHLLSLELGENFLQNRGILIVTLKDNFDRDYEETQLSFVEWKDQQKYFFKDLCNMCNGRILPFDNRSRPSAQTDSLFNLIWTLASNLLDVAASSQRSDDRYTSSAHKQYPPKLPRVSEADRYPLSSTYDRSKSHTHSHKSMESKDDKVQKLRENIDSLIDILTDANLSKKISALESLLLKVRSSKDKAEEKTHRQLKREIKRKIKDCEFFKSQDKSTCKYLQKLKEQYPSKLPRVSEADRYPLSSTDDRSKSHTHSHKSMESKDDKVQNLREDIDSLIDILTDANLSKKISALESLLLKVRSSQDKAEKKTRRALEREIERKIKDCEVSNSGDKNTCMYLQKLKEEMDC
ncbi:immune-associated nucleotide-binding protein 12 [Plakobranchus ocellatus]|uniref:Immune-associated nucleotide-binding protein 12 n=1 Tax=Plakobranchus ocellatus TaxID=259542 RepID=A0AAV3ZNM7_9GAST|nr:immune-associated nucleotide-binding protein 12 [Plakobranchus ocellatus]